MPASSVAGAPYPPNWGGGGYGGGPLSCTRVTRPPAQRTSGTLYGRATRRLPLVGCAPLPPRGMVEGAAGRAPLGGKGSDRTGRALGPVENSTASGPSRAPTMATRQPPQKGGSAGPPFAQREHAAETRRAGRDNPAREHTPRDTTGQVVRGWSEHSVSGSTGRAPWGHWQGSAERWVPRALYCPPSLFGRVAVQGSHCGGPTFG
jgi:hypothetical protein